MPCPVVLDVANFLPVPQISEQPVLCFIILSVDIFFLNIESEFALLKLVSIASHLPLSTTEKSGLSTLYTSSR